MSSSMFRTIVSAALGLAILTAAASQPTLVGQEKETKKAKAAAKGRLPAYFKDVVTDKQKTEIYAIQKKYSEQVEGLEQQLKSLQEQRDTEIEALLSAEQKEKLDKLRADAAGKRKSKTAKAEASETTEAEAATATTTTATTAAPTTTKPATTTTKSSSR